MKTSQAFLVLLTVAALGLAPLSAQRPGHGGEVSAAVRRHRSAVGHLLLRRARREAIRLAPTTAMRRLKAATALRQVPIAPRHQRMLRLTATAAKVATLLAHRVLCTRPQQPRVPRRWLATANTPLAVAVLLTPMDMALPLPVLLALQPMAA